MLVIKQTFYIFFINRVYICHRFVDNCPLYTYMFGYARNFLQVWVKTFIGINYNNLLRTSIFASIHYFLMFSFYALKRVKALKYTKSYISLHRHIYFFAQYIHILDIQFHNIHIYIRVLFDGP